MRIVIVGDGKVGITLTEMLSAEGHTITAVDSNPRVLSRLQEEYDVMAVQGHGAARGVLLEAGADEADLLIAATSADEVNLLSCLAAKKLGCQHTIARVRNPEYVEDLAMWREDMGLSLVINPEESCAREIFHLLQFPSFLGREQFAKGRVQIVKLRMEPGSPLINVSLTQLYNVAKVRVLVCAVNRGGVVSIPDGSFVIQEEDDLYITANTADLATLIKNLALVSHRITQVTLVGGSRLALYLAHKLLHSGVGVKIIEKDPARCEELADLLPEADVVEGDGTEQEILLAEGCGRADALVALTGIDEENIVLSMYARQLEVKRIITKCNRTQYADMFHQMGIDTVVSPRLTVGEEVVRYVRAMENSSGGAMVTMHLIADGRAEALEFRVDNSFEMLGVTLAELPVKKGLLIACILRGRNIIIPTGDSVIEVGDSVVAVTTTSRQILDLNDILEEGHRPVPRRQPAADEIAAVDLTSE